MKCSHRATDSVIFSGNAIAKVAAYSTWPHSGLVYENNRGMSIYPNRDSVSRRNPECYFCV